MGDAAVATRRRGRAGIGSRLSPRRRATQRARDNRSIGWSGEA